MGSWSSRGGADLDGWRATTWALGVAVLLSALLSALRGRIDVSTVVGFVAVVYAVRSMLLRWAQEDEE